MSGEDIKAAATRRVVFAIVWSTIAGLLFIGLAATAAPAVSALAAATLFGF